MSKLTAEQIAQHAYRAGFRGDELTTAVAVALAESGGNTQAHNARPPDDSYGLWQINMLDSLGPARRKQFHLDSDKELLDADENAKAAYQISSKGNNFEPWSTYTNGGYKKHLGEASKAAREVSKNKGKPGGSQQPGHDQSKGRGDGFRADTEALNAYTKKADHIADELGAIGKRTVHTVHRIAADSFGAVGKETGFSDALGDFSASLEKQVKTTGANARNLGASTAKAAKAYQANEDETIIEIKSANVRSVLG